MNEKLYVGLIEDDGLYQKAMHRLLAGSGFEVKVFSTAEEFLAGMPHAGCGCLVLDVRLPQLSGLDLQEALSQSEDQIPVVFLTGHGDVPMSVRAMKAGAVDFLIKPVEGGQLIAAIERGLALGLQWRQERTELQRLRRCYDALTPREREVFDLVVRGYMNKECASQLGTTERTIKAHRAQIMTKMNADSLATLVRIAERLERLARPNSPS